MNEEQLYQIKPGKGIPVAVDPDDPKGIKAIQGILRRQDRVRGQRKPRPRG